MTPQEVEDAVCRLVDDYRDRCLWFLRPDYHPVGASAQLRVLEYIERYGDLEAYRRAAALRTWLSPTSSAASAG